MGFSVEIKGLNQAIKRVEGLARSTKTRVQKEIIAFLFAVEKDAKSNLQRGTGSKPTSNTGKLAQSINVDKAGDLGGSIVVTKAYAAYVEFGTKKYAAQYVASLPADWQAYASKFKGKGSGSFDDLILALYQWIKDRGIKPDANYQKKNTEQGDRYSKTGNLIKNRKASKPKRTNLEERRQSMAYALAVKIVTEGTRAQPYLKPAIDKNLPNLVNRINIITSGR